MDRYKDEESCREFLVQQRWNGTPECPYCGCRKHYKIEKGERFKCANSGCYKKYSVTVGTIFESAKIPLRAWFIAIYIATSHKKGISSVQLAKDIGVTQKTAWFMLHRIREAMREKSPLMLQAEVQADESYFGGREDNKHKGKRATTLQEANARKMPIVGMVETRGRLVLSVMPWVTKRTVEDLILRHVQRPATLVTDGLAVYLKVGRKYNHVIIDTTQSHQKNGKTKNGIEGVWGGFNRMVYGIYHQVSDRHLQRYCDEFSYRYNSRSLHDGFRFMITMQQLEGRLTYHKLTEHTDAFKESGGYPIEEIETGE